MITKLLLNPRLRSVIACVKLAKKRIFAVTFQGKFLDKVEAEKLFNKHHDDVKASVSADKLLIFEASEGWGPLCKFLNVPVPNEPFPHLNKKENFKEMLVHLMKGEMV